MIAHIEDCFWFVHFFALSAMKLKPQAAVRLTLFGLCLGSSVSRRLSICVSLSDSSLGNFSLGIQQLLRGNIGCDKLKATHSHNGSGRKSAESIVVNIVDIDIHSYENFLVICDCCSSLYLIWTITSFALHFRLYDVSAFYLYQ